MDVESDNNFENNARKQRKNENENENDESHEYLEQDSSQPKEIRLKFRNYTPLDEKLRQYKLPRPEDIFKDVQDTFNKLGAIQDDDDALFLNLTPKKANWDLKRDIEKKLNRVERQTLQAITEIVRDKLNKKPKTEDK
jgi:coiled-coil domain-containing protein 12